MIRLLEYGKVSIIIKDGGAEIPESCAVSLNIENVDKLESIIMQ